MKTPGKADRVEDGNFCMTCGQDRSICLWNPARDDMKDGFLIKRYKGPHSNSVNEVSMFVLPGGFTDRAPDNNTFVSGGEEREVYLWDVTNAKVLRRFYGHSQVRKCLSLTTRGSTPCVTIQKDP